MMMDLAPPSAIPQTLVLVMKVLVEILEVAMIDLHQRRQVDRLGDGRITGSGVEENIVITLLPEKEGIFMFQHHNYTVSSIRRGSKVVRRYSDFVWLLDCLQKRYPFRQLPLLPPKRVGGM